MPNVLIACEESGIVRRAFAAKGWNAWSNDLVPSADNSPNHLQMDAMDAINSRMWDLIIMHPPCDALALSGNRWYGKGMRDHDKRLTSIKWTVELWRAAIDQSLAVALENPKSVIFPALRMLGPDAPHHVQFIQPHQFGHREFKETGFALHHLKPLAYENPVVPPDPGTDGYVQWQKVWRMPPGPDRKKMRSRTYTNVAFAMANQWGNQVMRFLNE